MSGNAGCPAWRSEVALKASRSDFPGVWVVATAALPLAIFASRIPPTPNIGAVLSAMGLVAWCYWLLILLCDHQSCPSYTLTRKGARLRLSDGNMFFLDWHAIVGVDITPTQAIVRTQGQTILLREPVNEWVRLAHAAADAIRRETKNLPTIAHTTQYSSTQATCPVADMRFPFNYAPILALVACAIALAGGAMHVSHLPGAAREGAIRWAVAVAFCTIPVLAAAIAHSAVEAAIRPSSMQLHDGAIILVGRSWFGRQPSTRCHLKSEVHSVVLRRRRLVLCLVSGDETIRASGGGLETILHQVDAWLRGSTSA